METPVTCCGIELLRQATRSRAPQWITYIGARGALTIHVVEPIVQPDEFRRLCDGYATVTRTWTGPSGTAEERVTIATACGSTAQGCADTLAEMVRSVAAALAGVIG